MGLLSWADVDLERGRVLVRRLKGGRWSEQVLMGATVCLLREYRASTRWDLRTSVFPGRRGPLGRRQIQMLFCRYRDAAGLPKRLTCHSLRHAIATHLLDAGMALEFIQDHLGHQDIRSTTIYARITDRRRAELMQQLEHSPWIIQPYAATPPDDPAAKHAA